MSTSAANYSDTQDIAMKLSGRVRHQQGAYLAPRFHREIDERSYSPMHSNMNTSNRSIEKRSFRIKRSNSKARSIIDTEEKTVDLRTRQIMITSRNVLNTDHKHRVTDETISNRTITTMNDQYLRKKSDIKREKTLPNSLLAKATKKRNSDIISKRVDYSTLKIKNSNLYGKLQGKVNQQKDRQDTESRKSALKTQLTLDKDIINTPISAHLCDEHQDTLLQKIPKRRAIKLEDFNFRKRDRSGKCNISLALQSRLKQVYTTVKDQLAYELFLCQRMLISVTKNKTAELDVKFGSGRNLPQSIKGIRSRVNQTFSFNGQKPSTQDDLRHHADSSDDGDSVDHDYKGFDYIRPHRGLPKLAAQVYANLEDAIQGQVNYCLTCGSVGVRAEYMSGYPRWQLIRRIKNMHSWCVDASEVILKDALCPILPRLIVKNLEIDLIIRDKKAKKFQKTYMEENGKINNDNFEHVTLWGYQIQKLLSRDLEKDFDCFKADCQIPLEVRVLNPMIIKQMTISVDDINTTAYEGIKELNSPGLLNYRSLPPSHKCLSLHEKILLVKEMSITSQPENFEFYINRFSENQLNCLAMPFMSHRYIGNYNQIFNVVDARPQVTTIPSSPKSKYMLPLVIITHVEDKSQPELESILKHSAINSPLSQYATAGFVGIRLNYQDFKDMESSIAKDITSSYNMHRLTPAVEQKNINILGTKRARKMRSEHNLQTESDGKSSFFVNPSEPYSRKETSQNTSKDAKMTPRSFMNKFVDLSDPRKSFNGRS